MSVPKKRIPKSRRNKRRSHHALVKVKLVPCSRCNNPVRPHTVCPNCGTYKGRQVAKPTVVVPAPRASRSKKKSV